MRKSFYNEKHEGLYNKFKDKKREYLMVLGGAREEDAKDFSMDDWKKSLKKSIDEFTSRDKKLSILAFNGMKGQSIYDKLSYEEKPFYCRVLDNFQENINLPSPEGDLVYDALVNLSKKVVKIHEEQFVPYSDTEKDDFEDPDKYEWELNRKEGFISELISYFKIRGLWKESKWKGDVRIDEKRYNYLLEHLVKDSPENIFEFEKEFVENIPPYVHMGFNFWPK